jgi:hypothetical protein
LFWARIGRPAWTFIEIDKDTGSMELSHTSLWIDCFLTLRLCKISIATTLIITALLPTCQAKRNIARFKTGTTILFTTTTFPFRRPRIDSTFFPASFWITTGKFHPTSRNHNKTTFSCGQIAVSESAERCCLPVHCLFKPLEPADLAGTKKHQILRRYLATIPGATIAAIDALARISKL